MFSEYTSKNILELMKDSINVEVDTREGSIFYDSISPFSKELAKLYLYLDKIKYENFIETAEVDNVIKRAYETKVDIKSGTYAKFICEFNVEVSIGDKFIGIDLTYTVTKKIEGLKYILTCDTKGTVGNFYIGKIKPLKKIIGLKKARMLSLYEEGENQEELEVFRHRYFDKIKQEFFSGNIEDYEKMLLERFDEYYFNFIYDSIQNILNIIVKRKDLEKCNQGEIQDILKSISTPIAQRVIVTEVGGFTIDLSFEIEYKNKYTKVDIYEDIISAIDSYFDELSEKFNFKKSITVRQSEIEIAILNVIGVNDIYDVKLNGLGENISIELTKIPKRGEVYFD